MQQNYPPPPQNYPPPPPQNYPQPYQMQYQQPQPNMGVYQEPQVSQNQNYQGQQPPMMLAQPVQVQVQQPQAQFQSAMVKVQFKDVLKGNFDLSDIERQDRNNFIRKVYTFLCLQLLVTVIWTAVVTLIEPIRDVVVELWAVTIVCFLITIALLILIFCKRNFAKKYPMNVIALFAFTLCETWIVAFVCAFYEPIVVLIAAILALGVTIGLTIYAYKTKKDFTTMGGMIWSLIISLILFSFFMIFFYSSFTHLLFCLFAIFVYSFFIIYDTQLIAGGRYAELTYDDYILGSVMLYIDIIGLFLYILSLLGNKG